MNGLHSSGPRRVSEASTGSLVFGFSPISNFRTSPPSLKNKIYFRRIKLEDQLTPSLIWMESLGPAGQIPKKSRESSTGSKRPSWGTRFGINQSRSHSVFILRYQPFRRTPPVTFSNILLSEIPSCYLRRKHQLKTTSPLQQAYPLNPT
jgi:hypothetical protein